MSLASGIFPRYDPANAPAKKKRVLLVDSSRIKRDLRSETMRKLGIEVDCAADISEARCWWRAALYDLVLMHVEDAPGPVDRFCNDLRAETPPQQIMFLVGGSKLLSSTPTEELVNGSEEEGSAVPLSSKAEGALSKDADGEPQNWGIMEACRQISAIRSVCDARTKAIRNRPEPVRDSETSRLGHVSEASSLEFIREELP